jgi:hypothetical protein
MHVLVMDAVNELHKCTVMGNMDPGPETFP